MAALSWDVAPDAAPLRSAAQVKRQPLVRKQMVQLSKRMHL